MEILYRSEPERGAKIASILQERLPDLPFHIGEAPNPADVEYLITWTVPDDLLETYPNLKMIMSVGAGVDQFDFASIPESLHVVRMIELSIPQQMAEYVAHAVLSLHRDMPRYQSQQQHRIWRGGRNVPAIERTIGVMGLGELGQAVLYCLQPFGFNLRGWNRTSKEIAGVETYTNLDDFLAKTDILICLLPLTEQTEGILSGSLFDALPKGAALINVGRGRHLDQDALLQALEKDQLSRAWLDVTNPEPLPSDHPFWSYEKITITPHIACQTRAEDGAEHIAKAIEAYLSGQAIPGHVNRSKGY